MKMRRPKKEGNHHLLSAFATQTIATLISKLKEYDLQEGSLCYMMQAELRENCECSGIKQIAALKKIGDNVLAQARQNNIGCVDVERALECLTFLFVKCKSKHPARRTIASIIHGLTDPFKSLAVDFFTENLSLELTDKLQHDESFHDISRARIETLLAFSENLSLGKFVIRNCFFKGLQFLLAVLKREISCSSASSSLDIQSAAMLNCLSALKAVIAVLNSDPAEESHQVENISKATAISQCITGTCIDLLQCATNILQDPLFMLDCRNTAGVAVVSLLQYLLPERFLHFLIDLILEEQSRAVSFKDSVIDLLELDNKDMENDSFNTLLYEVLGIMLGRFWQPQQDEFRCSKLILCHGLITKLSHNLLHRGETCKEIIDEVGSEDHLAAASNHDIDSVQLGDENNLSKVLFAEDSLIQKISSLAISTSLSPSPIDEYQLIRKLADEKKIYTRKTSPKSKASTEKQSLFSHSILNCLLENCSTVNEKGMTVYAYRTIYSWTVEALRHYRKMLDSGSLSCDVVYSPQNDVTLRLLHILNGCLDHPVDAVRHQARNSLENVIIIINIFPDAEFQIKRLLSYWLCGNLISRSKCLSLVCISDYVKIDRFLEIRKNLPMDLLDCLSDSNLASHVCDLYVKSASKHKSELGSQESNIEIWIEIWCEPVFKVLSCCDPLKRAYITDYVVPGLLKAFPKLVNVILERSRSKENSEDYIIASIVFLSSSRTLQECSNVRLLNQGADSEMYWHGLVLMDYMKLCLMHIDEQLRLDCLSLVCESNKSTEVLRKEDFYLLKLFIPLNMTSQSAKFRSQFVCRLKKAMSRVSDKCRQIEKEILFEKQLGTVNDRDMLDGDSYLHQCETFLAWLLEFLLLCLHQDSSFPRVVTALEIILTVLKIVTPKVLVKTVETPIHGTDGRLFHAVIAKVFSKESVQTLISCLYNSYEVNRSLATEILQILPYDVYTFRNDDFVALFEQGISLAFSPQPDTTNTSPHIMSFLANSCLKYNVFNAISSVYRNLNSSDIAKECKYNTHFIMASILSRKLLEQIEIAEKQLSKAAFQAPIHGTLRCVRELLEAVRIEDVSDRENWKTLIDELVKLCLRIRDIAGPIIQNSAPEGSIDSTGDHNVMISHILQEGEETKTDIASQASLSQMLLVCCWRSMKEATLLIGHIVSFCPIYPVPQSAGADHGSSMNTPFETNMSEGQILSSSTAVKIGNVFIDVLMSSRHIGAFELAYVGFVKVCHTFWRSEIDFVEALPSKWISDLLETLQSDDKSAVLCSTRRSAGIPFFISAICSTEPSINRRRTFNMVMDVLTSVCRPIENGAQNQDNEKISRKVICLNILRALFKDSKFGEDVALYASDGLKIAIKGFSSNIWAIRNACTMLFSALVSRVFLSRKFPMSGTEFFSRFPSLYSFMKAEIEAATSHSLRQGNHVQLHPSMFPLLLLLSHLYTSSMDGSDSKMKLSLFVPHVIRCGESGVYKTRVMAARALASIVTPGQLVETLNSLISTLPKTSDNKVKHNKVNGSLLQIQKLLEDKLVDNNVSSSLKMEIINGPLMLFEKHLFLISSEEKCSFNKACFLEIINSSTLLLTEEDWNSLPENTKQALLLITRTCLNMVFHKLDLVDKRSERCLSLQRRVGHELLRKAACTFVKKCFKSSLFRDILSGTDNLQAQRVRIASKLLTSSFCDVRESTLDWIATESWTENEDSQILKLLQQRLFWDEEEAECLAKICSVLVKSSRSTDFPCVSLGSNTVSCFEAWSRLKVRLKKFGKRESLISGIQQFTLVVVAQLHNEVVKENSNFRCASVNCIVEILQFVGQFCQPEESVSLRMSSAKVIGDGVFLDLISDKRWIDSQNIHLLFKYWYVIIDLLQDEDCNIRTHIAASIFPFIKNVLGRNDIHAISSCSQLPKTFCIQPNHSLQLIITSIREFYDEFPELIYNFLLSFVIGGWEKFESNASESSLVHKLPVAEMQIKESQLEYAVIFEQSEANSYKEELSLAHFAFEELQNLMLRHAFDPQILNAGFVVYAEQTLDDWSEDPDRFLNPSNLKSACQLLMGLCIVGSLYNADSFCNVVKKFANFCKKLDEYFAGKPFCLNCILQSHFATACWWCGI